ncbi:TIGR02556 family CRISPR-associated protein [Thermovorax subterraneus]|nr:TIGR02556 family CRISPR-associated protein [Thermovorax subterraneus]
MIQMLSAVKEIGRLVIEREGRQPLEVLVEDPNSNGNYKKVIAIVFEKLNKEIKFCGVELEDYESSKIMKYLYRSGAANGADLTPSAKLAKDPTGTFDRKILGWFAILDKRDIKITGEEREFLASIREQLEKNAETIKNEIYRIRDEIPGKTGIFITLKIKEGNKTSYIGDFEVFKKLLIYQVNEKDKRCAASDKVCSICGEKKPVVIGNLNTYAFYTLDKPGYITGGFREDEAWKNFPVCFDCKLALEEGKKYVEQYLSFSFCGIRYYLIPKFIVGVENVSEDILDIFRSSSKLISLRSRVIKSITRDEEDILYYLKDVKDVITVNFLFLQKMNAAERILLLIEDVFPSRIRKIFDTKECIDEIFQDDFTFGTVRSFFSKSDPNKRNYDLDGYFLDIVDRIFKNRPVSYHFLLQFMMKKIRSEFVNDNNFYRAVRDGLMVLIFLEKLKLIKMEEKSMEERLFDDLFKKYGSAFETPVKRGLFLLGALAELLLRKQFKERGAKPFIKSLKSLKMDEKDFKALLPKIQNKLEEYDSFDKGKRMLAKEISHYLLSEKEGWNMSVDEMNFYFAAGMNLVDEVAKIIYPEEKPEEISV